MNILSGLRKNQGFTLIELLIVITIIGILTVVAYVPYNYYSQLSRVRLSAEIVDQSINDAKILASNGYIFPGTDSSANIGLILRKSSGKMDIFAYQSGSTSFVENTSARRIKTISLENEIIISKLPSDVLLIYFTAPTGDIRFYREAGVELTDSWVSITTGWKGLSAWALSRNTTILKNY